MPYCFVFRKNQLNSILLGGVPSDLVHYSSLLLGSGIKFLADEKILDFRINDSVYSPVLWAI